MSPIFVELGDRWVSVGRQAGDAPIVIAFPARLRSGGHAVASASPNAGLYSVQGGVLEVGGPAGLPGPFQRRSGSTMPAEHATDLEDALLAVHAVRVAAGIAPAEDPAEAHLVLLTADTTWASRIAAAIFRLAGICHPLDGRVLAGPALVSCLAPESLADIAGAARQSKGGDRQGLLVSQAEGARILPVGPDSGAAKTPLEVIDLPPLYGALEAQLLDGAFRELGGDLLDPAQATVSPADALVRFSTAGDESVASRDVSALLEACLSRTLDALREALAPQLRAATIAFDHVVATGPDASIYAGALRAGGIRVSRHPDPVNGFASYALRALTTDCDMRFAHIDVLPDINIGEPARVIPSRWQAPVRFDDRRGTIVLRLPTAALDSVLIETLRIFANSTKPSTETTALLLRLLKVEAR